MLTILFESISTRGASCDVEIQETQLHLPTVETQLSPQWQKLNCLPPWSNLNSQLTLFQNPEILRTISSSHDVIHTPAPFPVWGLL